MIHAATIDASEADAKVLADALGEDAHFSGLAVDAAEVTPGRWRVVVYFADTPARAERAALNALAATTLGPGTASFAFAALPETDWVAKSLEGLRPVRVGRFLVHGSHDRAAASANDLTIEIEAAQAFGTGHHGTTAGCLAAIDRLAKTRRIVRALDVGTGSAVLAIAIAKRLKAPVLASDIDAIAVSIAADNVRLNGVAPLVRTICAAGVDRRDFARQGRFDLIVANILAGPLVGLAPAIRRHVAPGGTVVLSGLLAHQRNRVAAAYRGQGLRLVRSELREGWVTLTFERSRASAP